MVLVQNCNVVGGVMTPPYEMNASNNNFQLPKSPPFPVMGRGDGDYLSESDFLSTVRMFFSAF